MKEKSRKIVFLLLVICCSSIFSYIYWYITFLLLIKPNLVSNIACFQITNSKIVCLRYIDSLIIINIIMNVMFAYLIFDNNEL